jgi:uncharacterized iron-regulated protein
MLAFGLVPAAWAQNQAPGQSLVGQVWDWENERLIPLDSLAYRLANARWVILGERHDNPDHHRLQARFLGAMVAAGRRPAVVFEMIEQPQQKHLDALAHSQTPLAQWGKALAWEQRGWPSWSSYQPIFAQARAASLPLIAANLDRAALRQAATAPEPVVPLPSGLQDIQTEAVVAGHCNLITAQQAPPMVRAQVARDAQMAQRMRQGDEISQDGAVLITGSGHGRRDAAVPWHLQQQQASGSLITVAMVELPSENDPRSTEAQLTEVLTRYKPDDGDDKRAAPLPEHRPFDYLVFTAPVERPDPCDALRARFGQAAPQPK